LHVEVPPLDPAKVEYLDPYGEPAQVVLDPSALCEIPAQRLVNAR
jgi:hypothetical protein